MADSLKIIGAHTTNELNSITEATDHHLQDGCTSACDDSFSGTNILDLDDDSLLAIFKLLPLRDRLSFLCTHERFLGAFQMYAKASMKVLTEYDLQHLKAHEICYFFKNGGEYLETLTLLAGFEHFSCPKGFILIKLYCQNLKKLSLWGNFNETSEHFERFRELFTNKPNLRTLRFQRMCLQDVNMDLMLEPELPKLEHLSIVYCKEFAGISLKKFTNLRKLRLENLAQLDHTAVREALAAMPNLYALSYLEAELPGRHFVEVLNGLQESNQKLEILELNMHNTRNVQVNHLANLKHFTYGIRENNFRTTMDLAPLLTRSKQLESLRILSFWDFQFNYEQIHQIALFENLSKLHLPWKDLSKHGIVIDDESLLYLSALRNLLEFKACGENSFTKDGLLNLVQNCRKLKWVNVQWSLIDNRFASELLPIIEKETRPNGHITFLVYGSRMNASKFSEDYNSLEIKQKVEFLFDELFSLDTYDNLYDDFEHDSNFVRTPFCSYC